MYEFPEAVFLGVNMESQLGDVEVLSARHQKRVKKILSHHWIALDFLHEFLEAVFLGIDMESQLHDEEVWSARLE